MTTAGCAHCSWKASTPTRYNRLEKEGYDVELLGRALDEDELIARLDGVQLLGIRSKTQVTVAVLDAAPQLMAIGAFCIGTDQIDLAGASSRRHRRPSTRRSPTPAAWSSWPSPS